MVKTVSVVLLQEALPSRDIHLQYRHQHRRHHHYHRHHHHHRRHHHIIIIITGRRRHHCHRPSPFRSLINRMIEIQTQAGLWRRGVSIGDISFRRVAL